MTHWWLLPSLKELSNGMAEEITNEKRQRQEYTQDGRPVRKRSNKPTHIGLTHPDSCLKMLNALFCYLINDGQPSANGTPATQPHPKRTLTACR